MPSSRTPTQRDVAKLAGVAVTTVSYVVNGRRDRANAASPDVERRVREAMDTLGYRPNRAGRALQSSRTNLLAVAAYGPLNPWSIRVVEQVEQVADTYGYGVVIVRYGGNEASQKRAMELLRSQVTDAVVLLHSDQFGKHRRQELAARMPFLALGVDSRLPGVSQLVEPKDDAIVAAVDHLAAQGCRHSGYNLVAEDRGRERVFHEAVARHRLRTTHLNIVDAATGPAHPAFVAARELIERPARERPDSFLVLADRHAMSCMWAAAECGLTVPDDLRIIGGGNIPEAAGVSPPLTTLGWPEPDYAPAIHHLFRQIADRKVRNRTFSQPWELIVRGSA